MGIKQVSSKELVEIYDREAKERGLEAFPEGLTLRGFRVDEDAYIPYKVSTRVRLHEIAHLENPKEEWYSSPREMVDLEIEADLSAWRRMGKKPTIMVGLPAAFNLIIDYPRRYNRERAMSLVIGRLRHYGVKISWQDRMNFKAILGEQEL